MAEGVKRSPSGHLLSWREVLAQHKSLRGIARHSLLVDRGESGYRNIFLKDGRILYPGEGLGHQQPARGNAILLQALEEQRALRVFYREGQNRWRDLGTYRVRGVDYRLEEAENRYMYWFSLEPVP